MTSRFFVARLKADASGVNHLALKSPSTRGSVDEQWERANMVTTRGSVDEQWERANMVMEFKRAFDDTIAGYAPKSNSVDYSAIIEP